MTASPTIRPKLVVLAGPTGVGKTSTAIELAENMGGEIVNADSMQVYRYLDIGTAKPSIEERSRVPHHLIDVIDPDQAFDAAAYLDLARPLIADLDRRGIPGFVVGGTGFYLRSLIQGLFSGPGSDPVVRDRLKEEAGSLGREALHERLTLVDPPAAARIHPHDLFRVVRALEVFEITGKPISVWQREHGLSDRPYEVLFFGLTLPREILNDRIAQRTGFMIEAGLIEEVRRLLERYPSALKPFRAIGYKQVVEHLAGRLDRTAMEAEVVKQTRRYAKRQLTWLRAQPDVIWTDPNLSGFLLDLVRGFLDKP